MSISIYKYPLDKEEQDLTLPKGAKVLTVQVQNNVPHIWVRLDTSPLVEEEVKTFYIYGTGHTIPDGRIDDAYVGTFQLYNGGLVFHVFHD